MIFQMMLCGECYENVSSPLIVNVFITLATQLHLKYHYKTLFETPCITSGSHIEPQLSKVKLGVYCYITTFKALYMSSE
jgi:hypothetical protein